MNTARILLAAFCCAALAACARPRHPLPKPYVAVKGQPYYWEIDGDRVFNCFIRAGTEGHGYQTRNDPCRFSHDGNFNETDLKGAGFLLDGAVIVESSVPLLIGPFGPISSYDKRVTFPVVIQVVEPDSPLLAKCRRVDYRQEKTKGGYRGDAVAYDCGSSIIPSGAAGQNRPANGQHHD